MEASSAIGVAILVLVAVLTGALLPLILQARATLRSAQVVLDDGRPKLMKTLDELVVATHELRTLLADVDAARPRVVAFLDSVSAMTATLNQLQASIRTASAFGAAVGPAVVAAVQAFRAIRTEEAAHHRFTPGGADDPEADSRQARNNYE